MQPPEALQPYLDAFTDEINELRRRNAFLEDRYEFVLRRLEAHEDHQAEPDYAAVSLLALGPQPSFVLASLLGRYPNHVKSEWLLENLPNHDRVTFQEDEPLNQVRVIVSKVRRFFYENQVTPSVVSMKNVGYTLTPEAVAFVREK